MLSLDLGRLAREGSVLVEASVPADDPLWEGAETAWAGPVEVSLRATEAGTGEIIVRGTMKGLSISECRRCLKPVERPIEQDVTMVFVSSDTPGVADDGDVRVFEPTGELELDDAVREEVILSADSYVVCDPDCKGLCPTCGVDLNRETCACVREEGDPRWDALRALKESD
jgi:DUF177 domain-containing protein